MLAFQEVLYIEIKAMSAIGVLKHTMRTLDIIRKDNRNRIVQSIYAISFHRSPSPDEAVNLNLLIDSGLSIHEILTVLRGPISPSDCASPDSGESVDGDAQYASESSTLPRSVYEISYASTRQSNHFFNISNSSKIPKEHLQDDLRTPLERNLSRYLG